jgi:hypothetical protein
LTSQSNSTLLDLNTASVEELDALPGVDRELAEHIINTRPFRGLGDLNNVPEITVEIIAGILPHVTVVRPPLEQRPRRRSYAGADGVQRPTPYFGPDDNLPIIRRSAASRRRPVRERYRILATVFYGALAVVALGVGVWIYLSLTSGASNGAAATATLPGVAFIESPTLEPSATSAPPTRTLAPAATNTSAPTVTSEAPAIGSVTSTVTAISLPTTTLTPTVTRTVAATQTPRPTATATSTPLPTRTPAPTSTPTVTRTPAPTATASRTSTPRPTATPTVTPTFTPTLPPLTPPTGEGTLLFAENFEPARYRWVVRQLDPITSQIKDGALTVSVQRPNLGYSYGSMDEAGDVFYQATASVAACAPDDHYGLQVRLKDEANFYIFGVTCDGRTRAQVMQNGRYRFLQATAINPAVKTGANAVNVLAVRAVGDQLDFSVNGVTVLSLTDASLAAGRFGVYARAIVTQTLTVTFDDIAGWSAE